MDYQTIIQLVSSLGFPIVAYVLLFNYMKDNLKDMEKTISGNTEAITRLLTYMEAKEKVDIDGK